MSIHGNRHRPMTKAEIELLSPIKATKENPHLKFGSQSIYVNIPAGSELSPKVRSERIAVRANGQTLWKVGIEFPGGATPGNPMGNTVQRHDRTDTAGKISSHPSYRPEWMEVSFVPKTGVRLI